MANCRPKDTKCTKETIGHGRAGFDENFACGEFRLELGTGTFSLGPSGNLGFVKVLVPGSVLIGVVRMRVERG